jgi:ADP-heptose:LPS heptosyltransferase
MYLETITGLISNLKFNPKNVKSILIINRGALGDFIHSVPLYRYLKENGFNVEFYTKEEYKSIVNDIQYTDNPTYWCYDAVLNIQSPKNELIKVLKYNTFSFLGEKIYLKYIKKTWKEIHWAIFYIDTVKKLFNLKSNFKLTQYKTYNKAIIVHPGSSFPEKSWGIENFQWLVDKISQDQKTIVILGPNEHNLAVYFKKNKNLEIVKSNSGKDLINTLKQGKFFIGNDSGVMHVASLFDMPIFGIFTIGCAKTHFPYTPNGILYYDEQQFLDYYKRGIITKSKLTKEKLYKILNGKV